MSDKEKLIEIFKSTVKGHKPDLGGMNERHDGKKGHWLESQFNIHHNASNSADIFGYELKNETTSKTTFGDWSANEYIFNDSRFFSVFNASSSIERRFVFIDFWEEKQRKRW